MSNSTVIVILSLAGVYCFVKLLLYLKRRKRVTDLNTKLLSGYLHSVNASSGKTKKLR